MVVVKCQFVCNRDLLVLSLMLFGRALSGEALWRWIKMLLSRQLSERLRNSGKD